MKNMSNMSNMSKKMTTIALAAACALLLPAGAFAQVFTIPDRIEKLSEKFIPPNPAYASRQIYIDTRERFLEVH